MNKIALVSICINKQYWEFYPRMVSSADRFFLKGHQIDYIVWSDMPKDYLDGTGLSSKITIIPTEPCDWPAPTLFRYALFLNEEKRLSEYDYIFYVDADMLFVSKVGEEVLGNLTAAAHPMYYLAKMYQPPFEPNSNSEAFIKLPGRLVDEGDKKRFMLTYAAGGFQGGRSDVFIEAMKTMRDRIDADFTKGYVSRWNDETHWNRYLFDNPPDVFLSPAYVYPDSLISSYYKKIWGRNFAPKIITITKKFSLTKEGGNNIQITNQKL